MPCNNRQRTACRAGVQHMLSIVQAGLADAALLAQAAAAWALASLADSLAHLPSLAQAYQDHVGAIAEGECWSMRMLCSTLAPVVA